MASSLKDALKAHTSTAIQRGQPYAIGALAVPEPALAEPAGTLPEQLQIIARQYIGARQRSGEALLEAARWLSEARAVAKHGEWQVFLEATNTSDDTAERLLNIHTKAMQLPAFADAIRANIFSPTLASLLARESTPTEVIDQALNAPKPQTKRQIEAAIRKTKIRTGADFDSRSDPGSEFARLRAAVVAHEQPPAISAARTFETTERARMGQWSTHVLVRQADYRTALDHIAALLSLLEGSKK